MPPVPPGPPGPPRPREPDLPTTPARYLVNRYRLDRKLGRGAMGTVWAAHDESLDRWVAIKEVAVPPGTPSGQADQVAERAMREARAIASIADPHVVTVFDLVQVGNAPAIVMELLDATPISEVIATGGALAESQAVNIGLAVASALMAAHAAGVTHRDVKPGNVLLCRDGRIKLTDFGIARSSWEHTLTATGLLLGSPAYISPEVASGKPATPRSDIWGLGALLFACVQGRPPFDAGDPLRTLASVVQDPVPSAPDAGRLTALIGSLMQKDPRRRMGLDHAHRILRTMAGDPLGSTLVQRVWGAPSIPGAPSRPGRARPLPRHPTGAVAGPGATGARSGAPSGAAGTVGTAGPGGVPAPGVVPAAGTAAAAVAALRAGAAAGIQANRASIAASGGATTGAALPPPPWAEGTSAALRALPPKTAAENGDVRSLRTVVVAALVAVLCVIAGFVLARGLGSALEWGATIIGLLGGVA
ncbi:serine/threonine-protein kinase [Nakamurella alba]|uniref:serine/threonine-protein kinase n=1 Tax=Nakamurella alba TaxID=2665158 RepID=UPI0018AAE22F|nr:serine/threonine-protein kinase [Nakamurella alba]